MAGMIQKATTQNVAKTAGNGRTTMQQYIKQMEREIKKALPSVITPERFTRIVLSALSANPQLAQTTPQSFLGAMMTAAQLGVEPNTPLGQAYLIPYRNKGVLECQFQPWIQGADRFGLPFRRNLYHSGPSGLFRRSFHILLRLGTHLKARSRCRNRGEPVYVYAVFKTKDGGYGFEVMSIDELRAFAQKYSKAYGNGPWQSNFDEMAKKTVLKRVLKYAPLKSDFQRSVVQDETIKNEISPDMYSIPASVIEVDSKTGEAIESDEAATDENAQSS